MINFPKELINCTFIDDEGNRRLNKYATNKQKEIFEKLYNELNKQEESNNEFEIED